MGDAWAHVKPLDGCPEWKESDQQGQEEKWQRARLVGGFKRSMGRSRSLTGLPLRQRSSINAPHGCCVSVVYLQVLKEGRRPFAGSSGLLLWWSTLSIFLFWVTLLVTFGLPMLCRPVFSISNCSFILAKSILDFSNLATAETSSPCSFPQLRVANSTSLKWDRSICKHISSV
ncbi:hypothetical protein B0T17DRAFT_501964 [Bombardia bombarda]|uniref:Uncharacterized protein n=1 Tax=Bombardia bombarda TaxID=252184 RepID=A0AA40CDC3_9PEZI|nr:hypothetical protein B0T17DRAFT_501964 [Bombardia bombarda]